jgi:hypothetical protein
LTTNFRCGASGRVQSIQDALAESGSVTEIFSRPIDESDRLSDRRHDRRHAVAHRCDATAAQIHPTINGLVSIAGRALWTPARPRSIEARSDREDASRIDAIHTRSFVNLN